MSARFANLALTLSGGITGAALLLSPVSMLQANAGDCRGDVECYRKVQAPDVYAVEARAVMVHPGHQTVHSSPTIYGTRTHRVTVTPPHWHAEQVPAVWGVRSKAVLVRPAEVHYKSTPIHYRTIAEQQVVQPGGWRWEKRIDAHGREKLCKVKVPAVVRTVERKIAVGGERIPVVRPAVYHHVDQRFQISAPRTRYSYHPGTQAWVQSPVVVQPAAIHVVQHPPVYGVEHHKVLVRRGGHVWVPEERYHR